MITNLKNKIGTGISPRTFIDGMTRNRDRFLELYNKFDWNSKEDELFFLSLRNRFDLRCFILCTDWCPDVIWNVPVLFRVLEQGAIPTEVLIMEQHLETMDLFLTDGGRGQPIAVFINSKGAFLIKWGPRPRYIQAVMEAFRRENPDRAVRDYQEKVTIVRNEITTMYSMGTEYQSVIVRELRDLIESMIR
ncbi:thioredoxin family protein [Paenibacillus tarimensis]